MRMLPIERVLESALGATQLCVEILSDVRYCGSWYDAEPQTARGQFHLIGEGECLVKGPMLEQPVRLAAGDLAIFPHGTPHVLCAVPPAPGESAAEANYTSMLCGEMDFSGGMKNPVLRALPPVWWCIRATAARPFATSPCCCCRRRGTTGWGNASS